MMTEAHLQVAALWAAAALLPGIDFAIILRSAVTANRLAAFSAVLGIMLGTIVWCAVGISGVTLILTNVPALSTGIQVLGGVYLVYLGYRIAGTEAHTEDAMLNTNSVQHLTGSHFLAGLLANLTNPKTALFIAAVFAMAQTAGNGRVSGLSVGLIVFLISAGWYAFLAFALTSRPFRRGQERWQTPIKWIATIILIVLGLQMLIGAI